MVILCEHLVGIGNVNVWATTVRRAVSLGRLGSSGVRMQLWP
jgi:hypothetical protein